ncbi:hypothetical protein F4677DRAFT_107674 [Hypoxylon crocopeplum]|nr:hypothetical protein F4677DRAFT_107674 [Hypoxylon crocopeplum]
MAPSSQQPSPQRPQTSTPDSKADYVHDEIPSANELMEIASKSFETGVVAGGIGMVFGAGAGIVRSAPPTLFALVAGVQWFALGSTYMASRSLLWHAWGGEDNLTPSDLVKAGGAAGGVAGMVGGMFRGPRNIIPGILFFGAVGATSQYLSQRFETNSGDIDSKPKSSWLDSRWSPMKRLSDEEYGEKLEEKILRINAELSIIDENIASLRASRDAPTKPDERSTTISKS